MPTAYDPTYYGGPWQTIDPGTVSANWNILSQEWVVTNEEMKKKPSLSASLFEALCQCDRKEEPSDRPVSSLLPYVPSAKEQEILEKARALMKKYEEVPPIWTKILRFWAPRG